MVIVARKLAYQQIATILPNHTMNVAKQNLNPIFTTITRLSKTSKKDIPPSYQTKAFWEAMDNGREPHVEWSISAKSSTYQPNATRCNLCLDEKLAILLADPPSILTKERNSLASVTIKINLN